MTRISKLRPLARAVLRAQSDERLVALSREGRERAFEEIVRRYRPGLVVFATAYAPPDRAEDVVQESLISSWNALRGSTEEIRLKPWLYTIVRNRALNARRDARPTAQLPDDLDGVAQPPDLVLGKEELADVVAAISALPEHQRQALVRSAVDGHTHEQIAEAIGASPGAVRQLVYRARATVRDGVGIVIPLPLVRALADVGGAEALTGAVAGGAAIAGGAGGASTVTKATVAVVVGSLAAGSGVAIKHASDRDRAGPARAAAATPAPSDPERNPRDSGAPSADALSGSGGGVDPPSPGADDDSSGPGRDPDDEPDDDDDDGHASGPGSDGDDDRVGARSHGGSGSSSSSGSGDDPPTLDPATDDNSGSGSVNSGSGSANSGSGSDDEIEISEPETVEVDDDNSGSGSDLDDDSADTD